MRPLTHVPPGFARMGRLLVVGLANLLLTAAPAGGGYELGWYTIDGGGVLLSVGGTYELSGTVGQPDPGALHGGAYELSGGFWFGCLRGDCDCDADVDLADFAEFEVCLRGPGGGVGADCACFDYDGNGSLDLDDFAEFQAGFTG